MSKNSLTLKKGIGRNPKNLFATKENLFELVSEKREEQTILMLKNYL